MTEFKLWLELEEVDPKNKLPNALTIMHVYIR
jgi:hypothetical protein